MPRFFFDTSDGLSLIRDTDGLDLPSSDVARAEAIAVLPGLTRDAMPEGDRQETFCDVRDENGRLVFTATLSMLARWVD